MTTAAELEARLAAFQQEAGVTVGTEPGLELGVAAGNIIPSLQKNLGDLISAVTSPIETGSGLLSVAGGAMSKAGVPGLSEFEPYADAVVDMIIDRYGSVENAYNSIETDPIGVLMDFSGIAGVGGKLAKVGGFENAGDYIQAAANAIDPVNQASNVAFGIGGKFIPERTPENVYSGAAKIGTTLTPDERRNFNRTAVEQRITPDAAGLARLGALTERYLARVDELIAEAADTGRTVDATVLFDDLADLEEAVFTGNNVNKFRDLDQIAKVRQSTAQSIYGRDVKDLDASVPPKRLNAAELQELKKSAYAEADFRPKNAKKSMSNEANKAVGRSARKAVESIASPEIGRTNRQLGNLLEMKQPLERAVGRIENRNLFSLPQTLGVLPGIATGDFSTGLLGYLLGGLNTPQRQAQLAFGMERMREIPRNPVTSLLSSAPGQGLLRKGTYAGRTAEGLRNQGFNLDRLPTLSLLSRQ